MEVLNVPDVTIYQSLSAALLLFLVGKLGIYLLILTHLGHWYRFSIFSICSECVVRKQ